MIDSKYEITLEQAVTYQNYFKALKNCNRSVNYKFSVQRYNADCIREITESIRCIRAGGIPQIRNWKTTIVRERGTEREITPIDIADRVMIKVQCDEVLIPSIVPHLIYDNGASLEGKGTEHARRRLNLFIERAKREYGPENLEVVKIDFKRYFDSIPHELCRWALDYYLYDPRLARLNTGMIEQYPAAVPGRGICLGSQESQIMAVAVLNPLDHFIKDALGVRYYVRYMDDGVLIVNGREKAEETLHLIKNKAQDMGMQLHPRKTRITNARQGFTFLKIKYQVVGTKTLKRLTQEGISRERRRLKALAPRIEAGELPPEEAYQSMQSWNAHSRAAPDCYRTAKEMLELYNSLYGGYRMTQNYYKNHPELIRKRKVTKF